jgi:hypothetical protein
MKVDYCGSGRKRGGKEKGIMGCLTMAIIFEA